MGLLSLLDQSISLTGNLWPNYKFSQIHLGDKVSLLDGVLIRVGHPSPRFTPACSATQEVQGQEMRISET
jgi:hypothetical protein